MSWKRNSCPEMRGCALVCKLLSATLHPLHALLCFHISTTKSKYINGLQEDHSVILWNDTVNAVPQYSGPTVHLTLCLLPPCSRQPQPLESRSHYCPGAGREWQSTRGSRRWGSHCVWELEARTGESENQCPTVFSPQEESDESCARTWAGFSTVSRIRIERLFPSVWVDSSELSGETQRSPLENCLTIAQAKWVS